MDNFILKPIKDVISFKDFSRIDIRIGEIEEVEDMPKSNTLVKLVVNFGDHSRVVIAGLKQERENPEEIKVKQALFVVNLPPKDLFGEKSEAMLFDIGYENKITQVLAVPEKSVPNGSSAG